MFQLEANMSEVWPLPNGEIVVPVTDSLSKRVIGKATIQPDGVAVIKLDQDCVEELNSLGGIGAIKHVSFAHVYRHTPETRMALDDE